MTVPPTAAEIQEWSRVDFVDLDYTTATLERVVAQAVAYVEQVTGRVPLSVLAGTPLEPIAEQAVQMRVEQVAQQAQSESVEASSDETGVVSFSTPGYSETRAAPGSSKVLITVVNRWQALNDLLMLLMTPEKLEEWQAFVAGRYAPEYEVTEVDWSGDYFPVGPTGEWPGWGAL